MKGKYLYSVTDKSLFDALNQTKISNKELQDLFLSRGVIISSRSSREDLAMNFSKYILDYYDHKIIASSLGITPRKEKITTVRLEDSFIGEDISSALNVMKSDIETHGDLCIVRGKEDGSFQVDITYESLDYSKGDFNQIVQREARIEIEPDGNNYAIRRPDNDFSQECLDTFLKALGAESGKSISPCSIDLSNIECPEIRTSFFSRLIYDIDGFDVYDVTDAYVYKPRLEEVEFDDEPDEDESTDVPLNGCYIKKVSLKGEGVLLSSELKSLYEEGFYLCRVRWRIKERLPDPDIYEFEAQFSDPENCRGFSYISKGAIRYKAHGDYKKGKYPLTQEEDLKFKRLIERAADKISSSLKSTIS